VWQLNFEVFRRPRKKDGAKMEKLGEIEKFLLEEALYEEESVHGIIYGFLKNDIFREPKDVIDPIVNLLVAKKLKIYYQSGWGGDPYLDVTFLPVSDLKKYLLEYIEKHKKEFNNQYPENGGELFIETTSQE
jgi:hypothetical protein